MVIGAGYMDLQYKSAYAATPSYPLAYLGKEKGRQFQERNKNINKVSDRRI
jgi:hypothetical protein